MPKDILDPLKLVFNCEWADTDMVTAMDKHERLRVSSASNIDPDRTPLNRVLHGDPAGPSAALAAFFKAGPKPPSRRARRPYIRIVLGASPSFFRPEDPEMIGTWDDDQLEAWLEVAMAALRKEFGDDLVHVSLHLDEDTPHLHVLVAPTYLRMPRAVDRPKKGETDAAFAARKAKAAAARGQRTVGRASHPTLRLQGSLEVLRAAFGRAFAPLGIHPGVKRGPDDPKPRTTRQWVIDETARLKARHADLDAQFAEIAVLKESAVREAFAESRARESKELAGLRDQVEKLRDFTERWLRPLTALRREAVAEQGLVARIRSALSDNPQSRLKEVRVALHRHEVSDYHGGQLGRMQRDSDAELLKPYRRILAEELEREELSNDGARSDRDLNADGSPRSELDPEADGCPRPELF